MEKLQSWPDYLRRITGGLAPAEISKRSGIPLSTITRWLSGVTKPSAAKLDTLAKHFPMKLDEAHAIVAAYTTTPRIETAPQFFQINSRVFSRRKLLRMYSDLELANEIVRRIEKHDSVEFPQTFRTAIEPDFPDVIPFRGRDVRGSVEDEDLDAVARPRDTEPTDEQ